MSAELEDLRRRFAALGDEELLRIVTVRRAQYRQTALSVAEEELMRRGVAYTPPAVNYASGGSVYFAPATVPRRRGTAFWVGLLLIGCVSYWAGGMVDQFARAGAGEPAELEEFYEIVRPLLIISVSFVGGLVMRLWESLD